MARAGVQDEERGRSFGSEGGETWLARSRQFDCREEELDSAEGIPRVARRGFQSRSRLPRKIVGGGGLPSRDKMMLFIGVCLFFSQNKIALL